jgi:predicted transcriptional regulator
MESEGTAAVTQEKKPEVKLVDVVVTDENVALNLLVSFLNTAQRRGAFSIDESAKIWECVKVFQKK